MNYKDRVRKQNDSINFFAIALFGCITIAILLAAMGCAKDDDLPVEPETVSQQRSVIPKMNLVVFDDIEEANAYQPKDNEVVICIECKESTDEANKAAGKGKIVIFQAFTRNIPYIVNRRTGEQVQRFITRYENGPRYIAKVKQGRYGFYPVYYDRTAYLETPIRVKAGDLYQFGWDNYFPEP